MRVLFPFLVFLAFCYDIQKAESYTGSTPANMTVRKFLGISPTDSIDFVRWNLDIKKGQYDLRCNYGIGKPNTNGFIDGGKTVGINGEIRMEKNYYVLQNGSIKIRLAVVNTNLLHFLDDNEHLMVGNGGWSYTINSLSPSGSSDVSMKSRKSPLTDSIVFEGRTPCGVPGIIPEGKLCYKLKWLITLYADSKKQPPGYKVFGTNWMNPGGRRGTWNIIMGKDGRISYQLYDESGNVLNYLLKLDENIVIFTDSQGNLLTGDLDFSYTLNRR
jgi:hypothetical protein